MRNRNIFMLKDRKKLQIKKNKTGIVLLSFNLISEDIFNLKYLLSNLYLYKKKYKKKNIFYFNYKNINESYIYNIKKWLNRSLYLSNIFFFFNDIVPIGFILKNNLFDMDCFFNIIKKQKIKLIKNQMFFYITIKKYYIFINNYKINRFVYFTFMINILLKIFIFNKQNTNFEKKFLKCCI